MGSFLSRQLNNAVIEENDNDNKYKYPPKSGKTDFLFSCYEKKI